DHPGSRLSAHYHRPHAGRPFPVLGRPAPSASSADGGTALAPGDGTLSRPGVAAGTAGRTPARDDDAVRLLGAADLRADSAHLPRRPLTLPDERFTRPYRVCPIRRAAHHVQVEAMTVPNRLGRTRIRPVVLSGGSGTRLWPLSRALYPKQLLPLVGERTMLQETLERVRPGTTFAAPIIVCNEEHRFVVAEQARILGIEPHAIVLEPCGRNTAPAAAIAAMILADEAPDDLLLVMPSDHVVAHPDRFREAVAAGAALAGRLVTFGVTPTAPETGFGYIEIGEELPGRAGCFN